MKKIAITGGIGSGKSHLARRLDFIRNNYKHKYKYDFNIHIVSLDLTAKIVMNKYKSNFIWNFSEDFYLTNGEINKEYILNNIMKDKKEYEKLNFITANLIIAYLEEFYAEDVLDGDVVFLETATLFESGMDTYVDEIILVIADEKLRKERVLQRNTMSSEDIDFIMSIQKKPDEIRDGCSYIIENNGSEEELNIEIDKLMWKITTER